MRTRKREGDRTGFLLQLPSPASRAVRLTHPRVEALTGRSRRGGFVLSCVLVFCVLILSAQAPARNRRGSVLQSWTLSATGPLVGAAAAVSRTVSQTVDGVETLFTVRAENTRLKRELEQRNLELFQLRARVSQAAREERLAGSAAVLPNVLGMAPVLLVENRAGLQSALLGAGSADGVLPGSPIAVTEGLVGRVVTVGQKVSRAQLLTDASAAVGARIVRTGEMVVVRGDGRGGLRLNPTTSRVQKGDLVESAGIDGIYPRGVPIGRVAEVSRRRDLSLEIIVAPAAAFAELSDVLVLAPSPAAGQALPGPRGAGP
ncbi:MAG TPA: rod shape-determining protein MreC [Thermoanaerobaculia bacterium]|nr:rod shape-determining protein MreC [Thermoanaerobaculia bacterium]